MPHLLTQRGNRRQKTFFTDDDYRAYLELLGQWCGQHKVQVWAYCLMPNHVHLIVVPSSEDGLRRAIGEVHRRYTRRVNFRKGWRGHLWQGRFASFVMDEGYLLAAARYVETNPVRAKLVREAQRWRWSSAAAHLAGKDDGVVQVRPLLEMAGDWQSFLKEQVTQGELARFRGHERTGRPLGDERFVKRLEKMLKRVLARRRPGPKPEKRKGR
jgi:putative transposase